MPNCDHLARRLLRQHAEFDAGEDRAREILQNDPYTGDTQAFTAALTSGKVQIKRRK